MKISFKILTIITTATPSGLAKTLEDSELILPDDFEATRPTQFINNHLHCTK